MDDEPTPTAPAKFLSKALEEVGLLSLYRSGLDTKLLCIQRFIRLFAYGGSTLILAIYLAELGISEARIGLFMTLTLVGDVFISFILTIYADGLGRKWVLALGAAMMSGAGIAFGTSGNYWILLAAAIFGVISPSGNEIGPFRAIEESTLAHLTAPSERASIFAWVSLTGMAGTACGMITCGWIIRALQDIHGMEVIPSYRVIFFIYAGIGLLKLVLALSLSAKIEADKPEVTPVRANGHTETTPLLQQESAVASPPKPKSKIRLLPAISKESWGTVGWLALLFGLDNAASGLAPLSWVTYFFRSKFNLGEGKLGSLFFTTSIISAFSTLIAASVARRIGNVQTMVFTHLPSAVALALIPIPSSLPFAMFFLILRSCTQSMDVAPRAAFLSAAVLPSERTAVMGFLNVVKTSCQSLGPLITGILASRKLFWLSFVLAGSLKASYDLGMLAVFANHKPREEEARERSAAADEEQARAADEEEED